MRQKTIENPRICVVIVAWNSAGCIARCLESIGKSTLHAQIIVVDNDSADNTKEVVQRFRGVTYRNSGDNLGYSAAINIGLAWAERRGATYTLLLNPDAYLADDCLERMEAAMDADASVGLASPKIYYADTRTIWFAGATLDLQNGTSHHIGQNEPDGPAFSKNHDLPRANGCAMMVRMSAIKKVGLMDEKYFLYFEETDWSLRFTAARYRILFVASAHCWHATSSSTGGFFTPLYQYYTTRNSLYLTRKFGTGSRAIFLLRHLRQSLERIATIAHAKPKKAPGIIGAMVRAYADYALGRMGRRTK